MKKAKLSINKMKNYPESESTVFETFAEHEI
jgi:hypothetical protein